MPTDEVSVAFVGRGGGFAYFYFRPYGFLRVAHFLHLVAITFKTEKKKAHFVRFKFNLHQIAH